MRKLTTRIILGTCLSLGVVSLAAGVRAGIGCCAHCGQENGCQKVCRLVREDMKVSVTCWGCKTEEFCVPGPSTPGAEHCEMVCDESHDPKAPCVQPKKFVWTEWLPGCGQKVYTKKKLMKRTVTKTVPSFKWVVEDLCPQCEAHCEITDIPSGANIPPAPVIDDKIGHVIR